MEVRRKGSFVLKVDAFGLSVGKLITPQFDTSKTLVLERFETRQDSQFNVIYYSDGKWTERDLDSLVDLDDSALFTYDVTDDVYISTGSLVDYYKSVVPTLDKDMLELLKAGDKYKYKLSYEKREKYRKGKKRTYRIMANTHNDGSGGDDDDEEDVDNSFEDEIHEIGSTCDAVEVEAVDVGSTCYVRTVDVAVAVEEGFSDEEVSHKSVQVRDTSVLTERDESGFQNRDIIVFENELGIQFGKPHADGSTASVCAITEKSHLLYSKSYTASLNLNYHAVRIPPHILTHSAKLSGYIAVADPVYYVTWTSAAVKKRLKELSKIPYNHDHNAPIAHIAPTVPIVPISESFVVSAPVKERSTTSVRPLPKIGQFGYIGVTRLNDEKRRFVAHVNLGEDQRRVPGLFESPVEAALAHDEYALALVGSRADLNFVRRSSVPAYGWTPSSF